MHFSYLVYGLRISSDQPIPGLTESPFPETDISLSLTTEPDWLARANRLPLTQLLIRRSANELLDPTFVFSAHGAEEYFRLEYSDGTRFVLDHPAARLWGGYAPPLTIEDLAAYLLGPILGFVLRRRGTLALHASSIAVAGQAVVLVGPSEAGKSTVAAALALRGESILCEDISALTEESGHYFVEPGYPRVCLWPDSVEKLVGSSDGLPALTPTWEKRYLPLDGARARFASMRLPPGVIYLLGTRSPERSAPRIEPLGPREALLSLVQNTYMNYLLDRMQRAAEFDSLSRLVERVPVRRVVPHTDPSWLPAMCDLLIADAHDLVRAGQPVLAGRGL